MHIKGESRGGRFAKAKMSKTQKTPKTAKRKFTTTAKTAKPSQSDMMKTFKRKFTDSAEQQQQQQKQKQYQQQEEQQQSQQQSQTFFDAIDQSADASGFGGRSKRKQRRRRHMFGEENTINNMTIAQQQRAKLFAAFAPDQSADQFAFNLGAAFSEGGFTSSTFKQRKSRFQGSSAADVAASFVEAMTMDLNSFMTRNKRKAHFNASGDEADTNPQLTARGESSEQSTFSTSSGSSGGGSDSIIGGGSTSGGKARKIRRKGKKAKKIRINWGDGVTSANGQGVMAGGALGIFALLAQAAAAAQSVASLNAIWLALEEGAGGASNNNNEPLPAAAGLDASEVTNDDG